jgi:ABC-type multidrug transport system ATPase subunit
MTLLELQRVGVSYGHGSQQRIALREVSLQLEPGELVVVWGRRRSGRSTLMRVAAGIETPGTGVVRLLGRELYGRTGEAGDEIGFCRKSFRPAEGRLVLDQLVMSQLARGVSPAQVHARAHAALQRAGVEHCWALAPDDLDLSDKMRVAIARALLRRPQLLVLDEPTLGVELLARDGILLLLRSLADEGLAILTSTGETTALSGSDRALSLSGGELRGATTPQLAPVIPLRHLA